MYTDIPLYRKKSTFFRWVPQFLWPYILLARLDRPVGILLLVFPCWWGVASTGAGWSAWPIYGLFLAGGIAMRGAGCTYNDYLDRDYDRQVERTKKRPLASGEVSATRALVFLSLQLGVAAAVLFSFNDVTILWGIGSLGFVALYPLMKRWTYFPQAFLGATFNWGAWMGVAAVDGEVNATAAALYVAGILFTLCYDTIYAYQDKEDDLKIGVKSLAIRLGDRPKAFIYACLLLMAVFFGLVGWLEDATLLYYLLAAGSIIYYAYQTWRVNLLYLEDCLKYFKQAVFVEGLIFLALTMS